LPNLKLLEFDSHLEIFYSFHFSQNNNKFLFASAKKTSQTWSLFVMKRGYKIHFIITAICAFQGLQLYGQQVEIIKSNQLFEMIDNCTENSNIHVFNFWATWCAPCIRELPQFDEITDLFGNVDVTLISIDDVDLLNNKVKPFILKRKIESKVVLLDETDFDRIINNIDKSWSGAIPATVIVDCENRTRYFYEQEFKDGELAKTLKTIIN